MIREFELFSHWTFESFVPGSIPRSKYNAFKRIHNVSGQCFKLLASMEAMTMDDMVVDWAQVNFLTRKLISSIRILIDQLQVIHPVEFMDALEWFTKISFYTRLATDRIALEATPPFFQSLALHEDSKHDHLGLSDCLGIQKNVQVLVIMPALFQYFIEASDLRPALDAVLQKIDATCLTSLTNCENKIRKLILAESLPQIVASELEAAVFDLAGSRGKIDLWTFVGNPPKWRPIAAHKNISCAKIISAWKKAVLKKYSPPALTERLSQARADEEEGVLVVALPAETPCPTCILPQDTACKANSRHMRQRLKQVLPLVTDLHVFQAEGEPLRPEQCHSLHDLVCLCLEQGLSGIFAFAGEPSRGLAGIKQIRLEVPVIINCFNLGGGLFPSAAEKIVISMEDIRSVPAWSFLLGLVNPVLHWPGHKNENETPPPHYSSYAILDQFFIHCTVRLGRNLYTLESYCMDDETKYVQFRFKGTGPAEQSYVRKQILAQILEEEEFIIKVNGDYLEAVRYENTDVYLQRSLVCLGLLIGWIHTISLDNLVGMGKEQGIQSFRLIQNKACSSSL